MSFNPEIERLIQLVEVLIELQPLEYELSEVSKICGKANDTIRKYLITNYKDEKDYNQKTKNGKIFIKRAVVVAIRRHYVK